MFLGWERTSRRWVLMEGGGAPHTQGRTPLMCSCTSMEQAPVKHERSSSSCGPEWQRWASLWQGQPTCVLLGHSWAGRWGPQASTGLAVEPTPSLGRQGTFFDLHPGLMASGTWNDSCTSLCPALCPPVPRGGPPCGHSVWTCRLINWILINPSLNAWNFLREVFFGGHFFDNVAPRKVRSHTV